MSDFEETFKTPNITVFVSEIIANFWKNKEERQKEYQKYQEYKKYQEKLNSQKNNLKLYYNSPVVLSEESSV